MTVYEIKDGRVVSIDGEPMVPLMMMGAAPPMPPMVEIADGISISLEALTYFANAGDTEAARILADLRLPPDNPPSVNT